MIKYILKQLRRSAVTNALFCLLLTLAGTLLCISAGLWYSAHKALLDIDETITTIAIPDRFAIHKRALGYVHEDFLPEWEEDILGYIEAIRNAEEEIKRTIRDEIYTSGMLKMDNRRLFGAFAENVSPIPLRATGFGVEPEVARNSGQALAAFVVTCDFIHADNYFVDWLHLPDRDISRFVYRNNSAQFNVDKILLLHPVHTDPQRIRIHFLKNHDGSLPFELGKQYVVMGRYDRSAGIGDLLLDLPDVMAEYSLSGFVYSNDELYNLIRHRIRAFNFSDDEFPVEILEHKYVREFNPDDGWYSVIEIENSFEETVSSDEWLSMKDAMENAEISAKSFQVITTNNPKSFLRLNQNRNLFVEGRTFNSREIAEGARVCIVSRQFAEHNELSVGDTLPLQLYTADFGAITVSYATAEGGRQITSVARPPTLYNSSLEISSPTEFTIIGIYNTLRLEWSDYSVQVNNVFIPDNSFGTLEGEPAGHLDPSNPAPLLSDAVIVPNGRIDETIALINSIADGYGSLFRFYDQGYNSLLLALGNLRFGMSWILALSAASWVAVLFIFLMFYVARKRKEAALLYAIGIGKPGRFGWIFIQCAVLVFVALGLSITVSLPIYGDILDLAAGVAQDFTDSFRDLRLSDAADSGLRSNIPLDRSRAALLVTVASAAVITLITAGFLSARSSMFESLSKKRGDD
jgi:hypothetical protein